MQLIFTCAIWPGRWVAEAEYFDRQGGGNVTMRSERHR